MKSFVSMMSLTSIMVLATVPSFGAKSTRAEVRGPETKKTRRVKVKEQAVQPITGTYSFRVSNSPTNPDVRDYENYHLIVRPARKDFIFGRQPGVKSYNYELREVATTNMSGESVPQDKYAMNLIERTDSVWRFEGVLNPEWVYYVNHIPATYTIEINPSDSRVRIYSSRGVIIQEYFLSDSDAVTATFENSLAK